MVVLSVETVFWISKSLISPCAYVGDKFLGSACNKNFRQSGLLPCGGYGRFITSHSLYTRSNKLSTRSETRKYMADTLNKNVFILAKWPCLSLYFLAV